MVAQVAQLLGGIGLFLLGMRLMTEGLKVAAGEALRDVLARSTRTRLRGLVSGFGVTAIVQSSSAVTVATIGFVNAGLLSLSQALAVTYGSNIGTTMTGWLVAAIGFHVDVRAFALPLIGLGMGLRVFGRGPRLPSLGEAMAGFGIFFLGIETLRAGFEGFGEGIALAQVAGSGVGRALLFVGAGFLLTLLMQSSSAAIAIVLVAADGGLVPLGSGAALVIGANFGTTSTAALASIGATPNAKRVAAGHVAFNGITGIVALVLLPLLLLLIVEAREWLHLDAAPAAVLAAFHTFFNLMGVAIMLPLTPPLLRLLERRFQVEGEDEGRPRYLDRNVIEMPRLGFDAMVLELVRLCGMARRVCEDVLAPEAERAGRPRIEAVGRAIDSLIVEIASHAQKLRRARLPEGLDAVLPASIGVSRDCADAVALAHVLEDERHILDALKGAASRESVDAFVARARALVSDSALESKTFCAEDLARDRVALAEAYQGLKGDLLALASTGAIPVAALVSLLDWLSVVRRLAEHVEDAAQGLAALAAYGPSPIHDSAPDPDPEPQSKTESSSSSSVSRSRRFRKFE